MLKSIKNIFMAGVIAVSLLASSLPAFAATAEEVQKASSGDKEITLSVKQTFDTNKKDVSTKVNYSLIPETDSHQDGYTSNTQQAVKDGKISFRIGDADVNQQDFSLDGNASVGISFNFESPGLYVFCLRNMDKSTGAYTLDESSYLIRVYVRNDGNSFITVEDPDEKKVSEISYHHRYYSASETVEKKSSTPPAVNVTDKKTAKVFHIIAVKKWVNANNVTLPDHVTLALMKNGVTTDITREASAANNWTVDFGLYPVDGTEYSVFETDTPAHFTPSLEMEEKEGVITFTVTNKYNQPDKKNLNIFTGDSSNMILWGCIMGAAGAGIAVLIFGAAKRKKEKR